jgi:hypothetical protein
MATDILTATETYGKARTAFGQALVDAAAQREQTMIDLGASIMGQKGQVLTPTQAAKMLGPSGTGLPKTAKITTGIGEGALPTAAKEEAAAVYSATQDLQNRGVGTGGLVGQARAIGTEAGDVTKQQIITDATKSLAATAKGVAAARSAASQAKASLQTARGISPKKKG